MGGAEPLDDRQHHVDGGFVGADEHAPALQIAQFADGAVGLFGQTA